jgi:predicted acylesterase/phospholipase RssA
MMKALSLCGGGWKAAFQVGVLRGLLDKDPTLDYDLYAGSSAGALNAAVLAEGPLAEQLPKLEKIWLDDIKGSHSIYKQSLLWKMVGAATLPTALIVGACFAPWYAAVPLGAVSFSSWYLAYYIAMSSKSIYDTSPLRKLVIDNIDVQAIKNSGKGLIITSVDYRTGKLIIETESDDVVNAVLSSSAFPLFFPLHNGRIDGGTREVVPVRQPKLAGADYIDVILTSNIDIGECNNFGLFNQTMRLVEVMSSEIMFNDIISAQAESIRVFSPSYGAGISPLDFDPDKIRYMYDEGIQAGCLGLYQGKNGFIS